MHKTQQNSFFMIREDSKTVKSAPTISPTKTSKTETITIVQ